MNVGKLLNLFAKFIKYNNLDKIETKALNILNDLLSKISINENTFAIDVLDIFISNRKGTIICKTKNDILQEFHYEMICKKYINTFIINNVNRNNHYLKYKSHNIYNACIVISLLSIKYKLPNTIDKTNNPNISIKELNKQRYISQFEKIIQSLSENGYKINKKEKEKIKAIFLY